MSTPAALRTPAVGPGPAPQASPGRTGRVIAVIAASSAARLDTVVDSLAAQDTVPDVIVGVSLTELSGAAPWERHRHFASRTRRRHVDDGEIRELLGRHCHVVTTASPRAGLGAVVTAALRAWRRADEDEPAGEERSHGVRKPPWRRKESIEPLDSDDWLWILDDTSSLAPDALAQLLAAADRDPAAGLIGCKQRTSDRRLLNVGLDATPWGRPLPGVDIDELDQGQWDHRRKVLAVSQPGMLVRADVWAKLRGADPALRGVIADLDFGRRVTLAGHDVLVAPQAVATRVHSVPGHDAPAAGGDALPGAARGYQVYHRLVHARVLALPWVVLTVLGGALGRVVLGVAAASPATGVRAAVTSLLALTRVDQIAKGRRRAQRVAEPGQREVVAARMVTPRDAVRFHRDRWHRSRDAERAHARLSRLSPAVLRDRPCADFTIDPDARRPTSARRAPHGATHGASAALQKRGRPVQTWWLGALVLVYGALGALAQTQTWGSGALTSAALPVVPDSVASLVDSVRSGWVFAGLGQPGPHDPLLGPLAVLGVVALGDPATAVRVVFIAAPALAALAGWWLASALASSTRWRVIAAVVWGACPSLLLAISAGRLGAVLSHLGVAATVAALISALGSSRRRSAWAWTGVASLSLWVTVSAAPVLLIPTVALVISVAVWSRRLGPLLVTAPAVVALAPLIVEAFSHPRVLVADPGTPAPSRSFSAWMALLGWPGAPGPFANSATTLTTLAYLFGSIPLLLGIVASPTAFTATRGSALCRWGLAVVGVGVGTAALSARTTVGWAAQGQNTVSVSGWPGHGVSLAVLGLLMLALAILPRGLPTPLGLLSASSATQWPRVVALGVAAACALASVGALGGWAWQQRVDPAPGSLTNSGRQLPQGLQAMSSSGDHSRVLVLNPTTGQVRTDSGEVLATDVIPRWSLTRFAGPRLDLGSTAAVVRALDEGRSIDAEGLAQAFVDVLTSARTPQAAFGPYAIGAIAVLPGPGAEVVATRLAGTPGLLATGEVGGVRTWRVLSESGVAVDAPDRPAALRLYTPGQPRWQAVDWVGGQRWAMPRADLGPGPAGRVLEISERFDPRWRARLGETELTGVPRGFQQGFEVPQTTAVEPLQVFYRDAWHTVWLIAFTVTLVLAVIIAIPLRGTRG